MTLRRPALESARHDLAHPSFRAAVDRPSLSNAARSCLKHENDAPAAITSLFLQGLAVSPVQLRRATLYPAELRVRGVHLADWSGLGNG
jgi:hypothetical protein